MPAGRSRRRGRPTVCVFKNVTVEANGVKWQMPRAELRNEDGSPRVVWKAGGGERRLDLFSGEIFNNSKPNKVRKMKKLITLMALSWTALASAQTADQYIAAGTNDLTLTNWWGADTNFTAALAASPTNETPTC